MEKPNFKIIFKKILRKCLKKIKKLKSDCACIVICGELEILIIIVTRGNKMSLKSHQNFCFFFANILFSFNLIFIFLKTPRGKLIKYKHRKIGHHKLLEFIRACREWDYKFFRIHTSVSKRRDENRTFKSLFHIVKLKNHQGNFSSSHTIGYERVKKLKIKWENTPL